MPANKTFTFATTDEIDKYLINMAILTKLSKAEVIRRGVLFMRIVMDPKLKLEDIVTEKDWKKSLQEVIIPIPILKTKIQ